MSDLSIPEDFADGLDGQFVDLPFESGSAYPAALEYANLPAASYDPEQDWRAAQAQAAQRMYGEFAPGEEATDG